MLSEVGKKGVKGQLLLVALAIAAMFALLVCIYGPAAFTLLFSVPVLLIGGCLLTVVLYNVYSLPQKIARTRHLTWKTVSFLGKFCRILMQLNVMSVGFFIVLHQSINVLYVTMGSSLALWGAALAWVLSRPILPANNDEKPIGLDELQQLDSVKNLLRQSRRKEALKELMSSNPGLKPKKANEILDYLIEFGLQPIANTRPEASDSR